MAVEVPFVHEPSLSCPRDIETLTASAELRSKQEGNCHPGATFSGRQGGSRFTAAANPGRNQRASLP